MSLKIENAIRRENWKKARQLIQSDLRREPNSHWLLSRMALTYYEEHQYKRALTVGLKAYKLQPNCPLVLWDLAGTLGMLGRYREASAIYRRLIRRGVKSIAFGDCGEGLVWARGLVADCWYRMAGCARQQRHTAQAVKYFEQHLDLRGPGCRSIYPLQAVRKELTEILKLKMKQRSRGK